MLVGFSTVNVALDLAKPYKKRSTITAALGPNTRQNVAFVSVLVIVSNLVNCGILEPDKKNSNHTN